MAEQLELDLGDKKVKTKKKKWASVIATFVIIVILALFFLWFIKSDFFRNSIVEPSKLILSGVKNSFLFGQFSETRDILTGKKSFSLEGDVEEKKKSGIEISELKPFGDIEDEFGVSTEITVWKFDDKIKKGIDASVSCNLYSELYDKPIPAKEIRSTSIEEGKSEFTIFNPEVEDKREIPIDCVFSNDQINVVGGGTLGTVKFGLTYSFSPEVSLEVFVAPQEKFEDYSNRFDEAFKYLEKGSFSDYRSKVPSKMKYITTDIEAVMNFKSQPLFVGKDNYLVFKFKNKDIKNEVDFKGFSIDLPNGLEFENCKYFMNNKLDEKNLKSINKELNNDNGESKDFECKVKISKEALGESGGEIVKMPEIIAKLNYDYILKKEKNI